MQTPQLIERFFEQRQEFSPGRAPQELVSLLDQILDELDSGKIRVAEPRNGEWHVNEWIKKAILLYFKSPPINPILWAPCRLLTKSL